MRLMIIESPNKSKKIAQALGPGWEVAASFGHIRDLPPKDRGVDAPDYRPTYEIPERSKPAVAKLQGLVKRADEVYLATDPDREGEAISWHLQQVLRLKNPKRVTFNEITEKAVKAAVASPRTIDEDLVRAQEARRVLDRVVGWDVSPHLSRAVGAAASAGRVQSPAVRLVVDREIEIENFRETKHFGARATFDDGAWSAEWDTKPFLPSGSEYILDRALAGRASLCRDFTVESSETKPATKNPPAPFTTNTLLQAAANQLNFKAETTQQIAQKLFEGGHITYHRTDSQNLSDEAIEGIRALAAERGWPVPSAPRRWGSKAGAQEAHEAIRPTHLEMEEAGDDDAQRRLYRLIWLRAIACQLAPAEYDATSTVLLARDGEQTFRFRASGRVLKKQGWRILTAKDAAEEEDDEGEGTSGAVPQLKAGTSKKADSGEVLEKTTKPPPRFSEASLLKELEKRGIGRPATYASILATIITRRNYVEVKKKNLLPTLLGRRIVEALRGKFSFVELDYTRGAEEELDAIASGKASYLSIITKMHGVLQAEMRGVGFDPDKPFPPSAKMASFAQTIASTLGLELPETDLESAAKVRTFLEANVEAYQAKKGEAQAARMAAEGASEKQIAVIQKAIDDGKAQAPEGWPELSKLAASQLIDKIMGGDSTKSTGKPAGGRRASGGANGGRGGKRSSGRASGGGTSGDGPRYASDKQMGLLRSLVGDNKISPPPGWPDKVTISDASAALDKAFAKNGKGARK